MNNHFSINPSLFFFFFSTTHNWQFYYAVLLDLLFRKLGFQLSNEPKPIDVIIIDNPLHNHKNPIFLWDEEPVCLGVLRELNARLSNRRNQEMFGWAKFVGLRFGISRNLRFKKGNFPLQFQYRAICKSRFRQNFLLKTKYILYRCVSSPLTSPYISLILCLNASASQGLVLSSTFLLCSVYRRSSSQFQVTVLHYPSLNFWYRFGLHHIYILSPLLLNSSVSLGLALFFVFALLRSSSFFIAISGNYSPLPIFEFMI